MAADSLSFLIFLECNFGFGLEGPARAMAGCGENSLDLDLDFGGNWISARVDAHTRAVTELSTSASPNADGDETVPQPEPNVASIALDNDSDNDGSR